MGRNGLIAMLVALGTVLAGCGPGDPPSGTEVVRISSQDHDVDLVLTDASLYMALSEAVLEEVNQEIERERAEEPESGLGQDIETYVLGKVESMLSYRIEYPLDEVHSVTYANGEIMILVEDEHLLSFDDVETDGGKALTNFNSADARRFVEEFDRLKRL